MKRKRSPAQIAATKRMLAARAQKLGSPTFTKSSKPSALGAARKPSALAAKSAGAKSNPVRPRKRRKSNPSPAPAPSAPVASNPTENPVKANRRKRKQSRKARAASLRNLRKARRSRRRRRGNPVKSNPAAGVKSNPKRRRKGKGGGRRRRAFLKDERRRKSRKQHRNVGRVRGYTRKGYVRGHTRRTNPVEGLMSNQGPFTASRLANYGVASLGLGLGLFATEIIDRVVATRKPEGGNHPWFGRAAVAAQMSRPDAMRLGAQAATGLGAMGLAYVTRNVRFVPWFFTGLAFAAGAKLVQMGVQWWVLPMAFPIKPEDQGKPIWANRIAVIEQKNVQDAVAELFKKEKWSTSLQEAQAQTPVIRPVLGGDFGAPGIYTLGGLDPRDLVEIVQQAGFSRGGNGHGQLAGSRFHPDGTEKKCGECGSVGGHVESCGQYCSKCDGAFGYEIQPQDNLAKYAQLAGISPAYIAQINGNRAVHTMRAGEKVKLPFLLGVWMQEQWGPELERHPSNQNGGAVAGTPDAVPPPPQRASGQDFIDDEGPAE